MSDPIQYRYKVAVPSTECLNPPATPAQDSCQIQVLSPLGQAGPNGETLFTLQREGNKFEILPQEANRVARAYPSYTPNQRELREYLKVKREFFDVFGDSMAPTDITNKIRVLSLEGIFTATGTLENFLVRGSLAPEEETQKRSLEVALQNLIATFADPTMGLLVEKTLKKIQSDYRFSEGTKKKAQWLLQVDDAREKYWNIMKPEIEKSIALGDSLKASSRDVLNFLFANHILAEKGFKAALFGDYVRSAATKYHEVMSQLDPEYDISKNFYQYMTLVLRKLKQGFMVAPENRDEFNRRIDVAISEFQKAAATETERLLPKEAPVPALKIYLKLKYGNTPMRAQAVDILLDHLKIQVRNNRPTFLVPMAGISVHLKNWAESQEDPKKRAQAVEAINYLLAQLFEQNGKMEIYWDKKKQKVKNLYYSENLPLIGTNKTYLEGLIRWARQEAEKEGIPLGKENTPNLAWHKMTLAAEGGTAVAGALSTLLPYKGDNTRYVARGIGWTVAGTATGAAVGDVVCHLAKVKKNDWICDVVGGVVGGIGSSLLYFNLANKPSGTGTTTQPPPNDPGKRNPVDEYDHP